MACFKGNPLPGWREHQIAVVFRMASKCARQRHQPVAHQPLRDNAAVLPQHRARHVALDVRRQRHRPPLRPPPPLQPWQQQPLQLQTRR